MMGIRPKVAWCAAALLVGCGGSLTPDATGGGGGGSGTSTRAIGSMVAVGTGGASAVATSGVTSTGVTTGAGGTGGCPGGACCDPSTGFGAPPIPVTLATCSDFDSDNGAVGIHCVMPGGVWSADVDGAPGSTSQADSYKIEPCGTTGNGLHFVGQGHSTWGADVAAALVSQIQPVDVSGFIGMSFVMRSTTTNTLIFKVQNSYSQPPCGRCDDTMIGAECYSGFIKTISLPANYVAPLVVKWADLSQQTWGYRPPGWTVFDPRDLVSVAFAFDKSVDFDVCIDDVKLVP
jgi:hypothetical protein